MVWTKFRIAGAVILGWAGLVIAVAIFNVMSGRPESDEQAAGQPATAQPNANQPSAPTSDHPIMDMFARWAAADQSADAPHAYLGVELSPVTPEATRAAGLDAVTGAIIANVVPDSPAANAGIRPGDFVIGVEGQGISSVADLQQRAQNSTPGARMTLTLLRPGPKGVMQMNVFAVLGSPAAANWASLPATGAATLSNVSTRSDNANVPNFADERTDFGVPPQSTLRDGNRIASQTPTTIPGLAGVISTVDLMSLLQQNAPVVLLDVWNDGGRGHATIPGAAELPFAGGPGTFTDATQRDFSNALAIITHNNRQANLVFFCTGATCWESYNTALRAINAGYPHVFWYRGGLTAWQQAGYPLSNSDQGPQSAPAQNAGNGYPMPSGAPGQMGMPGSMPLPGGMGMPGGMPMDPNAAPMDMSALIARQGQLQAIGDQAAQQAALAWYNDVQQYRMRTGDWTSPINPPVTTQSLQASISGANEATQRFMQSGAAGSDARATTTENYSTRGILGMNEVYNPTTGTVERVDGSFNTLYLNHYGQVQGTASNTAPPGTTELKGRW